MKKELVHSLTGNFEDHAQRTEGGVEFWLARDLQHLSMIRSKDDQALFGRNTLLEGGIRPESLPAEEDIKKVQRRIASEDKKSLGKPKALEE
jgi:DNA-damage-inducible protein D